MHWQSVRASMVSLRNQFCSAPPDAPLWRIGLAAIVTLYAMLAVSSVVTLPVFEGIDEQRHYAYARYLVHNRALPPVYRAAADNPATYEVGQESGQPPLLYALVALVTAPIAGADDVQPFVQENPYMIAYDVTGVPNDNHNRFLRTQLTEDMFSGVPLANRMGRMVAVVLGILTLAAVYGAARAIAPAHSGLALVATALVATQPVFIFITSIVSNDAAVVCFSALSIMTALRILRESATRKWALLGGLFSGLAVLGKFNGIWMIGVVGLAIILDSLNKKRSLLPALGLIGLAAAVWLGVTGWWFAHNALTSGDAFGLQVHAYGEQSPLRFYQQALDTLGQRLADLELSTWYFSGWAGMVPGPTWLYTLQRLAWGIGALGAVGAAVQVLRHSNNTEKAQAFVLVVCAGLGFAGALYWILVYMWSLGRLMFPALAAAAILSATGWVWWWRQFAALRWHKPLQLLLALLLPLGLLVGAVGSVSITAQAFASHPDITGIEPQMNTTQLTFMDLSGNGAPVASVVAYEITRQDVRAGGALFGRVCWQSHGYAQRSYPYSLQLVGEGDSRPGTRNSYHGLGSYALSRWKPDEVFCDPVSVLIDGDVTRPRAYSILVSLFDFDSGALPVVDANNNTVYPIITRVRVAPRAAASAPPQPHSIVGDFAGLVSAQLDAPTADRISVSLRWVALARTNVDAKVFMHVLDASGKVIAQHDHQPDNGWFPTPYWETGDVVDDMFDIVLPAGTSLGELQYRVGIYDAQTLQRLPAMDARSHDRYRDDLIPVSR